MNSSSSSTKDWKLTILDLKRIEEFPAKCPNCKTLIKVIDTTTEKRLTLGLHYLLGKCINCKQRVEAVGIGLNQTRKDYKRAMKQAEFDANPYQRFEIVEQDMW